MCCWFAWVVGNRLSFVIAMLLGMFHVDMELANKPFTLTNVIWSCHCYEKYGFVVCCLHRINVQHRSLIFWFRWSNPYIYKHIYDIICPCIQILTSDQRKYFIVVYNVSFYCEIIHRAIEPTTGVIITVETAISDVLTCVVFYTCELCFKSTCAFPKTNQFKQTTNHNVLMFSFDKDVCNLANHYGQEADALRIWVALCHIIETCQMHCLMFAKVHLHNWCNLSFNVWNTWQDWGLIGGMVDFDDLCNKPCLIKLKQQEGRNRSKLQQEEMQHKQENDDQQFDNKRTLLSPCPTACGLGADMMYACMCVNAHTHACLKALRANRHRVFPLERSHVLSIAWRRACFC